ncbi:MAG: hypothetical protein JOZ80_10590 [Acidobacteriaceae bacterium]|nr:hypothetical protein [Acidobacteriaceae bacterium]
MLPVEIVVCPSKLTEVRQSTDIKTKNKKVRAKQEFRNIVASSESIYFCEELKSYWRPQTLKRDTHKTGTTFVFPSPHRPVLLL